MALAILKANTMKNHEKHYSKSKLPGLQAFKGGNLAR